MACNVNDSFHHFSDVAFVRVFPLVISNFYLVCAILFCLFDINQVSCFP